MKFIPGGLAGVVIVEPEVFSDPRGFFFEAYHQRKFAEGGIETVFVQDNHSRSAQHTLRGLHTQRLHRQAKLVRVLVGTIFDVVVDIRRGSPTYRRWISTELSAENHRICFVPGDYAHGFCVISEVAEVEYKTSNFYSPADELRIAWNDPSIGVAWPTNSPLLSTEDARAKTLDQLQHLLPVYQTPQ